MLNMSCVYIYRLANFGTDQMRVRFWERRKPIRTRVTGTRQTTSVTGTTTGYQQGVGARKLGAENRFPAGMQRRLFEDGFYIPL